MKEERRNLDGKSSQRILEKEKRAANHSRNSNQLICLSKQLIERSRELVRSMVSVDSQGNPSFDLQSIPSISDIRDRGRRQMDKDNLERQMQEEDARSSRLQREKLTLERVK